jgi:DNA-binding NarL/FixJ family response regulator
MSDRRSKVRVLIAGMPRMLTDIIRNIVTSQPDLEFAGEAEGVARLARIVKQSHIDVLVIDAAAVQGASGYKDLLYQRPRMSIVAIDANARGAQIFDLRPHVAHLGEISPTTLVAALRRRPQSEL